MGKEIWNGSDFSLAQTVECGQCFRFHKKDGRYTVIAGHRVGAFVQEDDSILFYGEEGDIPFWRNYFDWERDYGGLKKQLSAGDAVMAEAISYAPGIHLLRQEFFEMLISFIISQNNHIPRIQGIIARICERYGREIGEGYFAFPTPEELALADEEALRRLGCGFRARYIVDAVEKAKTKAFSPEILQTLPTEALRQRLMEICGVGQKVADCVMLFSLGRYEVFPADVWIRRVMSEAYFAGNPLSARELQQAAAERFGAKAGFAQQYLFHYGRGKKIGK
ncbi:MAG: DNA-3-methyladenine glycosylase 2 family protein [Anaerotignum sp.]|nr:DNA-3-methyladenine glycosylase 2 family protein [Anaerotignum sp.]